jgi:hypothetical protein
MEIITFENDITISNGKVTLFIKDGVDGFFVSNQSKNTAVFKKKGSRDEFLFTNAEPIQSWKNYDLLIGDSFKEEEILNMPERCGICPCLNKTCGEEYNSLGCHGMLWRYYKKLI